MDVHVLCIWGRVKLECLNKGLYSCDFWFWSTACFDICAEEVMQDNVFACHSSCCGWTTGTILRAYLFQTNCVRWAVRSGSVGFCSLYARVVWTMTYLVSKPLFGTRLVTCLCWFFYEEEERLTYVLVLGIVQSSCFSNFVTHVQCFISSGFLMYEGINFVVDCSAGSVILQDEQYLRMQCVMSYLEKEFACLGLSELRALSAQGLLKNSHSDFQARVRQGSGWPLICIDYKMLIFSIQGEEVPDYLLGKNFPFAVVVPDS